MQEKIKSFPTGRDFWVAYDGRHTEPTFLKDEGDGQGILREIAYRYVTQWRGCIDAGANVGMWTRFLMQDFEKVHCFEPNPMFIQCWKKNIPSDKHAELHEVGLGEAENTASFDKPLAQRLQREPGDITIKTLDSFELTNIDFIKIDVDGYEDLLLQGAKETLTNNSPVINIEMKTAKRPEVVRISSKILSDLGYKKQIRTRSEEVWTK
jgi:FkbM family methyltransferase